MFIYISKYLTYYYKRKYKYIVLFIIYTMTIIIILKYIFTIYKYYLIQVYSMSDNKGNLSMYLIEYYTDNRR